MSEEYHYIPNPDHLLCQKCSLLATRRYQECKRACVVHQEPHLKENNDEPKPLEELALVNKSKMLTEGNSEADTAPEEETTLQKLYRSLRVEDPNIRLP